MIVSNYLIVEFSWDLDGQRDSLAKAPFLIEVFGWRRFLSSADRRNLQVTLLGGELQILLLKFNARHPDVGVCSLRWWLRYLLRAQINLATVVALERTQSLGARESLTVHGGPLAGLGGLPPIQVDDLSQQLNGVRGLYLDLMCVYQESMTLKLLLSGGGMIN